MPRPILKLKKPLDKRPTEPSQKLKGQQAGAWLESTYPDIFDRRNPKPLAIGIRNELHKAMPPGAIREGLRPALAYWCRRRRYRGQIAAGGQRYQIDGQTAGDISKEHQAQARSALGGEDKGRSAA